MFSGLFLRNVRISSVARENRDGATSCARIDADRSSMMTRSSRSYCGIRVVSCACGRTSANTSAPPASSVSAGDRRFARPGGAARERAEALGDRRQPPLAPQVQKPDGAGGEQDRQDLPPGRELRAEEPHALAGPARRLRARGGWPQQLHQLLRRSVGLLAQLRGEPRGELEVELGVPVVGRRFDRLAELLLGAAQPAEARLGRLLDGRLLEERARRPRNSATRRPAPSARRRSPRRSASAGRARAGGCRPRGCIRPARSASPPAARRSAPSAIW